MTRWTSGNPRLAFEETGHGEVVLFLHGVGGNRRNWYSQLPVFARHFRAVTWDARGYGDSDDYGGELSIADYADDVRRLLDHLEVERAHLVGLSMGGNIAMQFALTHPKQVMSLALCDTDRGMTHLPEYERSEFLRLRSDPLLNGQGFADLAPVLVDSLVGPQASAETVATLRESLLLLRRDMYIKSVQATLDFDITKSVKRICCPTLVVVGEFDRLTPLQESQAICSEIRGSRLVVIPRAGHLSNIEEPEIFNRQVLRFLLDLPARPSA